MAELPAPLTPPHCDLQDFSFMPLQVARLRDSDFAAEECPEACWYAVLLWSASWHQVPAGSLPENENVLMRICGLGRDTKTWKRHREGALRGFVKCSDGRLYHTVVCEQANEAWEQKLQQRYRTECARIRKGNERNKTANVAPTYEAFVASMSLVTSQAVACDTEPMSQDCPPRQSLQGTGTGTGTVKKEEDNTQHTTTDSAREKNETKPKTRKPEPVSPHPTLVAVMTDGGFITQPSDWKTQLQAWKDLGADFESDILPALRKVAREVQERGGQPPRMLKFFDNAVREKLAADQREAENWRAMRLNREAGEDEQISADIATAHEDLAFVEDWSKQPIGTPGRPPDHRLAAMKANAEAIIERGPIIQAERAKRAAMGMPK